MREASELAPHLKNLEGFSQTQAANQSLAKMEETIFRTVRARRLAHAQTLLKSKPYTEQRRVYAQGIRAAVRGAWAARVAVFPGDEEPSRARHPAGPPTGPGQGDGVPRSGPGRRAAIDVPAVPLCGVGMQRFVMRVG